MQKSSHSPERIECGDREALAAFLMKYRSRLLRRIRGKLTAIGATEIDEEDILSTCARRLDLMCMGKRLPHLTEDELIAYALRTATNAAHNMILTESRRRRTLQRLWRESQHLYDEAVTEPDESAIQSLLAKLAEDDRRMVELRLRGMSHVQIANEIGTPLSTERTRWQRLRTRVKALLATPGESSNITSGRTITSVMGATSRRIRPRASGCRWRLRSRRRARRVRSRWMCQSARRDELAAPLRGGDSKGCGTRSMK